MKLRSQSMQRKKQRKMSSRRRPLRRKLKLRLLSPKTLHLNQILR